MIGVQLDLEPGETAYFQIGARQYALCCVRQLPDPPPGNGAGRSLSGGQYQTRQLADRNTNDDLPPDYEIEPRGHLFIILYGGEQIGWAPDRSGALACIEKHQQIRPLLRQQPDYPQPRLRYRGSKGRVKLWTGD